MDYEEKDTHVTYIIKVLGKTKYLVDLEHLNNIELYKNDEGHIIDSKSSAEFYIVKRYSELRTFHLLLQQEVKAYIKKKSLA